MRAIGFVVAAIVLTTGSVGCVAQPLALDAPSKKRGPPPRAPFVNAGKLRYQAIARGLGEDEAERGGYVAAIDRASGRALWEVRVYAMRVDPDMERDKLDVFIAKLALAERGRALLVTDERGGRYRVDLATRGVTAVE